MHDPFAHETYATRRNFFAIFNTWFRILDPEENIAFFSKMKAFKLKEDIRIFAADKTTELLRIEARQIIDFGATYDVFDSRTGEKLGTVRRKGLKSMFKDEWIILNTAEQEIGLIREDSGSLAFLRRFVGGAIVGALAPQVHFGSIGESPVLAFKQTRNPFITKTYLDFSMDHGNLLDRRMGIAISVLFGAIEGKQG